MTIIKKFTENNNTFIKTLICIVITSAIIVLLLNTDAFTDYASNLLAENTFYIPRKQNFVFNGLTLLKEACFGSNYYEFEEKIIIIHENDSQMKANDESIATTPESSVDITYNDSSKGMLPIISCDLSSEDILTLNNTTAERPDTSKLLMSYYDFGYDENDKEPLVLIVHTHATECYSREDSTYYDPDSLSRSTNENVNMIAVGKVLAETLNDRGISTLHCTLQHDADSYRDSYSLAAESIRQYLEDYPSIRYVFDVHRDAVMYESGAKARAVTEIDGKEFAQIMLLAGTDAGGANFPGWKTNLTLALKLADKLSGNYPGLMRPIALRGASYNEQYTPGSLLIEIGTDGNTLTQAKNSAIILAQAIASLIKGE